MFRNITSGMINSILSADWLGNFTEYMHTQIPRVQNFLVCYNSKMGISFTNGLDFGKKTLKLKYLNIFNINNFNISLLFPGWKIVWGTFEKK